MTNAPASMTETGALRECLIANCGWNGQRLRLGFSQTLLGGHTRLGSVIWLYRWDALIQPLCTEKCRCRPVELPDDYTQLTLPTTA